MRGTMSRPSVGNRGRRPERSVEFQAHRMEINHRHLLLRADLPDRLRVIGERRLRFVPLPPPPLHRRHQHRDAVLAPGRFDEPFKVRLVTRERPRASRLVLLIVVAELNEQEVAFLHHAQNFREPFLVLERIERQARLRLVRHRHTLRKEARQHLPPARPRLARLVGNGGISGEKNRNRIFRRLDLHRRDAGMFAIELESQVRVSNCPAQFPSSRSSTGGTRL